MTDGDAVARGRSSYARREWADAYQALCGADKQASLGRDDLSRLAWAAALIGRDNEMIAALERLYQAEIEAGDELAAARSAFWLGFRLFSLGERGRATAWLARAERLVERQPGTCAIAGYLLIPRVHQHLAQREFDLAAELAERAEHIGEKCREPDLLALSRNLYGRALLRAGRIDDGLKLLDEAMLSVTAGELSPVITGIIYCNVIAGCQQIHAVERSREWTLALSSWCDAQPQLVKFTGACLAHRAEIMQFGGDWTHALVEARRATTMSEFSPAAREAAANGFYQLGEVHRLRGDTAEAEAAYRHASELGREPQPGLALLRLAQGQRDAAATAIRRVLDTVQDPMQRVGHLFAFVEIMIDAGSLAEADRGCTELEELARRFSSSVLRARAAQARGMFLLASGDARAALAPLTQALSNWQELNAPYYLACCRVQLARACERLEDHDTARFELGAARSLLGQLGAKPALASLEPPSHGLTPRELEVLGLVATGKTNKGVARQLDLSEKTVDRHVSNIFAKLGLATRAAATAYAYEHGLLKKSPR
jgi:DNA-binding CsgD family transcriptional regulator